MAFDKNYWREELPLLIQGYGGYCAVRLLTYWSDDGAGDYLVRQVMKTDDGYGIFDVYLDSKGASPIISGSSSTSDFDIAMPSTSKAVSLPYENIADVQVKSVGTGRGDVPCSVETQRRLGSRLRDHL